VRPRKRPYDLTEPTSRIPLSQSLEAPDADVAHNSSPAQERPLASIRPGGRLVCTDCSCVARGSTVAPSSQCRRLENATRRSRSAHPLRQGSRRAALGRRNPRRRMSLRGASQEVLPMSIRNNHCVRVPPARWLHRGRQIQCAARGDDRHARAMFLKQRTPSAQRVSFIIPPALYALTAPHHSPPPRRTTRVRTSLHSIFTRPILGTLSDPGRARNTVIDREVAFRFYRGPPHHAAALPTAIPACTSVPHLAILSAPFSTDSRAPLRSPDRFRQCFCGAPEGSAAHTLIGALLAKRPQTHPFATA